MDITVVPITSTECPITARPPMNLTLDGSRFDGVLHLGHKPWRQHARQVVDIFIQGR